MLRLQELGFTNAYALLGGLSSWTFAKYPTDTAPPDAAPEPPPVQTQPQPQQQPPASQPQPAPPQRQMETTQPPH